jgi:class 3 adenylate cyclase/DNA-binding CsgD family transcriptional regulator
MHRYGATTTVVHTDVAGSTAPPERVGPARRLGFPGEHAERLREHLPAYGGTLLRGGGDGHLLAFPSCRGALHWAVGLQRAADGEPLLRFAMGIHVGEPAVRGDELHGRTVVKASRLAALARGGEVVVSRLVRELADGDDPLGEDIWFGEERSVELRGVRGRHAIAPLHWQAAPAAGAPPCLEELTEREREVLGLIAEGLSNRAIAEHLVVTLKTIETHVGQIFLKLDLRGESREHRRVAAALTYLRAAAPV